ncbi:PREDICTED: uncharacterized protein LOC101314610 [Fragaria vesca subsp. vesca]|uniref:uncharacterized protein LOC101314610 n=1 Tax=Fragaria vesca subsp. vesca TaxID=101020 RepID=UPI0002C35E5F|nr:PREDICTED: uncharacterized protein LOC101314610 [Fragaria vesca subsp. vesca]
MIGILTRTDNYDRCHFLPLVYGVRPVLSPRHHPRQLKFVFCSLTKPKQRALIALEMLRFDDILILNCTETMNSGKTYTYFSLPKLLLPRKYDYIMMADDDVFIRFEPLALSLKALPRVDLYYGFVIPCASMDPFVEYMSGMGFLLSWDLVEWIRSSEVPKENVVGPQDKLIEKWFKMGNKAMKKISNKPAMYDYPGTNERCSHELIPETVAVHRLKRLKDVVSQN